MRNSDHEKELGIDFSTNKVKITTGGNILMKRQINLRKNEKLLKLIKNMC